MTPPHLGGTVFSLALAVSRDGFIARAPGHAPAEWCSAEEQALFFSEVAAADWSIMGRGTHLAADKPTRRRIIFSSKAGMGVWRRPTQLWIDPAGETPASLAARVSDIHPCQNALILGGTSVHDWFLSHEAIDRITLTIEPVVFGSGLRAFGNPASEDLPQFLLRTGFQRQCQRVLNPAGTIWAEYMRGAREAV